MQKLIFVVLSLLAVPGVSRAQSESKDQYNLFHPTPANQMRDLSTDRPDKTEGPFTVDAGHFQIETDIVNLTLDHEGDTRRRETSYLASNLKVGLTNNSDLQLILTPYHDQELENGSTQRNGGFGDTTLRLKINFLGNDGGPIGLGLMPFVKIPTDTTPLGNKVVEAGLIFPVALELPRGWDMGFMLEYDHNKNSSGPDFHNESIASLTLGHGITEKWRAYGEVYTQGSDEPGSSLVATLDGGLIYLMKENLQLDFGFNGGLTPAADDGNPFLGISARF